MSILRAIKVEVLSSTKIQIEFNLNLDSSINSSNFILESNSSNLPNPEILKVVIKNNKAILTVRPLFPYFQYFLTLKSSDISLFKSVNGVVLAEDDKNNVFLILGAEDSENKIRDYFLNELKDDVYNLDYGTLARDVINITSDNIRKAEDDIGQLKNDNYLSLTIENELKTRGSGPIDRLNEKGAYKVIKVSKNLNGTQVSDYIEFSEFPFYPITLQRKVVNSEALIAGNGNSTFNQLTLSLKNKLITRVNAISFRYSDLSTYTYDISSLGYQIKDSKYDQDYASSYDLLETNQVLLSSNVLEDSSFKVPTVGDTVYVSYEYKDLGRLVEPTSIYVYKISQVVREVVPPILNVFSLPNYPIVNYNGDVVESNGIQFLDPQANPPFSSAHPAFSKEIPFRLDALPKAIGEYSVDYVTGTVYVYGAEINDGTGDFPPVVSYYYKNLFINELDYIYDENNYDLVRSPLRNLEGDSAIIEYTYEKVLVEDLDYVAYTHKEILDERVENRFISTNSFTVKNAPVTNVYRIYNETSGEIYQLDRFNFDKVYFKASTPPRVVNVTRERVQFKNINNETLFVKEKLLNSSLLNIFKIELLNNKIGSATEDCIGSSFNSSASFSNKSIFEKELYYDYVNLTEQENIDKLNIGQYLINYNDGIVYVAVNSGQDYDVGLINYKTYIISTENKHIVSVYSVYNSIVPSSIYKQIQYNSIEDQYINLNYFELSDEKFLNNNELSPYIVNNNQIIVTDDISSLRGIYDLYDLNNNLNPINFAENSVYSSNIITLDDVNLINNFIVSPGLTISIPFISSGIELSGINSIIRVSDGAELYDIGGSFSGYTITLSGINAPAPGDEVIVNYSLKLNGSATPVVDYARGDLFIDYDYIADEILVSYDYGDDYLDFSQSDALNEGDNYYVTYNVGADRNALLKNFGSLVNIPILNNFDTSLPREQYRDALRAAFQSFAQGPTLPSIKSLVEFITHIPPEIIESAFENWNLGVSHLFPKEISTTGNLQLSPAKFNDGILIKNSDESITFPVSSNLKLEEGTLEMWVIPQWNGIDNDASLTFNINRQPSNLTSDLIYIGASGYHPEINLDGSFTLNKNDDTIGLPASIYSKTGAFIYFDSNQNEWKFLVKEKINDGYTYSGTIETSGNFYNSGFIPGLGEITDKLKTKNSKIEFTFNIDSQDLIFPDGYSDGYSITDGYYPLDGYVSGYSYDGIKFMSDNEHYLFDFAKTESKNRFSLFKDGSGYLNFKVFDNNANNRVNSYALSADISDWKSGEAHHVAVSWKLSTKNKSDEMHLFIDGKEVPNIIKYGGKPQSILTDRFRAVKPEYLLGTIPKNIVTYNDLVTDGTNTVYSQTINFNDYGITSGDLLEITEFGLGSYTISSVAGNYLTLTSVVPASVSGASFTVNPYSVIVSSEVDLYKNIVVSVIRSGEEIEIPGLRAEIPGYSVSRNVFNQNVLTILGNANAGDQLAIRTLGLNFRRAREKVFVWSNSSNILKSHLPSPINLDEVKIFKVILPKVAIGPDNSTFSLGLFNFSTTNVYQTTSSAEGRSLAIKVFGGNVDFSTPMTVTINGTTNSTPNETLTFTAPGVLYTNKKFKTITSISSVVKPYVSSKSSAVIEIKERYTLTYSEGNSVYPVIRYSYKTQQGSTLSGSAGDNTVSDSNGYFIESNIGQSLIISSPISVAGTYEIISRNSNTSIEVSPAISNNFSNGVYEIYNASIGRSGFANGFFTFETAGQVNVGYLLSRGYYEFDYSVNLEIPFDPLTNETAYLGSDFNGKKQANAVLDEVRILSNMLTDVRIGETLSSGEESITVDAAKIKEFKKNSNTLFLMHANDFPLKNDSDFWVTANKDYLQSSFSVNENFGKSLVINNKPLKYDNIGYLSTKSEGTIEFWVSPIFDTVNDPKLRFYFDAAALTTEEVTSISRGSLILNNRVNSIESIYVSGDSFNYAAGAQIQSDYKTIKLSKALPYQKTNVKITYTQFGVSGDRLSIYKDEQGFINFYVKASGTEYQVRQPVLWTRNSWHRIKVTFKFNRQDNQDEIRLFVDGEERGTIRFGTGLLFGSGIVFGQGFAGVDNSILTADMNFLDEIPQFFIGSDINSVNLAQARIDNLKISNIVQPSYQLAGQLIDNNYNSNINTVLPVVEDVYTTFLLNFNDIYNKNEEWAILRDKYFGIYNFIIKIIDSFDIVSESDKVKQILETLINILKPAQSKVNIEYIK